MKINSKYVRWGIPTLGIAAVFALVAWTGDPQQPTNHQQLSQDTVPAKRNKATRDANEKDLDKEIRELEEAKIKLKDVNWDQIKKSIEDATRNINLEQIQQQVEQAMKQVDMEKINLEIEKSIKKVDFEKIQREIDESLKQAYANIEKIDKEEIKREIEKARLEVEREMKGKDWQKEMEAVKKELAETKKFNKSAFEKEMQHAREEVAKAMKELDREKLDIKADLENAWEGIDKAKEEFKGYQEMIYSMEKEGLLSTKSDYTIKYRDGELLINGKKQPEEVVTRYKKYFRHGKVTIRKEEGDMDIDTDDLD